MFVPLDPRDTTLITEKTAIVKDSIRNEKIKESLANTAKQDSIKENILSIFPEWQGIQILSSAKNATTEY